MKRRFYLGALTLGLATGALILTSCSTPETRISDHPDLYQSLSARDRALVSQGQIRPGMSRARSKNYSEHARPSDRNLDLRLLRDVSLLPILWSLRTVRPWCRLQLGIYHCRRRNWNYPPPRGLYLRILRRPLLRSILLFDAAQYSVSRQGGDFLQRPRYVVSVPGTELERGKNSVAFCERLNQYSGTP